MNSPQSQEVPFRDLVPHDVFAQPPQSSHDMALARLGARPRFAHDPAVPFSRPAPPAWLAFCVGLMGLIYQAALSPFSGAKGTLSLLGRGVMVVLVAGLACFCLTKFLSQTPWFFALCTMVGVFLVGIVGQLCELVGKGLVLAAAHITQKGRDLL